jgi:hypothetical protein
MSGGPTPTENPLAGKCSDAGLLAGMFRMFQCIYVALIGKFVASLALEPALKNLVVQTIAHGFVPHCHSHRRALIPIFDIRLPNPGACIRLDRTPSKPKESIMFKRLISTALIFGTAAMAPPAMAQSVACMPRTSLVQTLADRHGERLTGGGLRSTTQVVEIWSSDKTGSFTVFVSRADGISCVIATGQNWQNSAPKVVPDGVAG